MKALVGVSAVMVLAGSALVAGVVLAAGPSPAPLVAQAAPAPARPKGQEGAVVTVRGTVEAIDAEKQTVTLKGPKRSLTVHVRDKKKLEAVKVGDPVVARYYEAVAFEVKKPGTAAPGVVAQQGMGASKPGAPPAGVVGERITVTATIVAIDKAGRTVTLKGPEGTTETVRARNPRNLEGVAVGDLVEITYTRALAIALDRAPTK